MKKVHKPVEMLLHAHTKLNSALRNRSLKKPVHPHANLNVNINDIPKRKYSSHIKDIAKSQFMDDDDKADSQRLNETFNINADERKKIKDIRTIRRKANLAEQDFLQHEERNDKTLEARGKTTKANKEMKKKLSIKKPKGFKKSKK